MEFSYGLINKKLKIYLSIDIENQEKLIINFVKFS